MLVRLKMKLAEIVNDVDLSHCTEGDVIDVAHRQGKMLIAEGWAERAAPGERVTCHPKPAERSVAADRGVPPRYSPADTHWWDRKSAVLPPRSARHEA